MSERIATEDNQLSHIEQRLNKAYRENKKLQLENHQLQSSMKELQGLVDQLQKTTQFSARYEQQIVKDGISGMVLLFKHEVKLIQQFGDAQEFFPPDQTQNLINHLESFQRDQPLPQQVQFIANFVSKRQQFINAFFAYQKTKSYSDAKNEIVRLNQQISVNETEHAQLKTEHLTLKQELLKLQADLREEKSGAQLMSQQLALLQGQLSYQNETQSMLFKEKAQLQNKVIVYENEFYQAKQQRSASPYKVHHQEELMADTEIDDIYKYFRQYFKLIESMVDVMPWDVIKECFVQINTLVRANFNHHQELGDMNNRLAELEIQNKRLLGPNNRYLDPQFQENIKLIEGLRKEVQGRSQVIQENQGKLRLLTDQYKQMCTLEERRFNCQIKQEKQLMTARERIQSLQQYVEQLKEEPVKEHRLYTQEKENIFNQPKAGTRIPPSVIVVRKTTITFQPSAAEDQQLKNRAIEDQQTMIKMIQKKRQKLSTELKKALYFENQ